MTYIPPWACKHWGGYEHDWLDCSDCIEEYEKWLENPEKYEANLMEKL